MLAFISCDERGKANRILADLARDLEARGWPLAGAVQVNVAGEDDKCDMDLHVLSTGRVVRITQDLGALSEGCRLDPDGLEQAVGLAAAVLDSGARLAVVNKFGRTEAEGRGFRPFIGQALASGVPVILAVGHGHRAAFESFADGMATELPADAGAVLDWCTATAV